jgi:hypothetical protein
LHRAITEARRFLVAARLEDHPLPVLLAPRLSVELFPALSPGIDRFISMCGQDRTASEATGRPVGQPTTAVAQDEQGDTVYVTSERFQLTEPVNIVLSAPAGVLLDRLIKQLNLPHHTNLLGAMVTRYEYRLVFNDSRLSRDKSLASQDVRPLAVLQLEVQPNVFGPETPTDGIALPAFRGRFDERERALEEAERAIKIAVQRAGLGY